MNKIRHSNLADIEETDFDDYIEVFVELLSDDKYFKDNANEARAELLHVSEFI